MSFEQLFTQIQPEALTDNVFTLVGKDLFVITAGTPGHFNSMTASGGGLGLLFRNPATWCTIQQGRYTLELMQEQQAYTLSFFPDEYRDQLIFLGTHSGRDTDKMKEVSLVAVQTPAGNITYEEARLVFECRLTQMTTPALEDFYAPEARAYLEETYQDRGEQRKYVFGEITALWVKR